jgi:tetratricopeptide (TPR) repeat protein
MGRRQASGRGGKPPTGRSSRGSGATRARETRSAKGAPERSAKGAPERSARAGPRKLLEEIRSTARPGQAEHAIKAFEEAVAALERERAGPAVSAATRAKDFAPRSAPIREVLGIALYRAERFRDALRELQAYRRMTARLDQNHLIADSYRALGSPEKAIDPAREAVRGRLSDEIRAEAAIVGASALADLGRFSEALSLLRASPSGDRLSRDFDLRVWYVTGDILERAGRRAEAAEEFRRVVRHDPGAFDAAERLASLNRH